MALSLQPQAGTKQQRIHASAEPSCLVEGDEDWLRQVLENLIGNAIKYSPEQRSIWLCVRRNGASVLIEVRDEGAGLTEDDKAKLFGRLQRLSARPTGGETRARPRDREAARGAARGASVGGERRARPGDQLLRGAAGPGRVMRPRRPGRHPSPALTRDS
jgi:hypothetical protein